jgi:RNA polymerase sigma-70 factor (ECF subfamily)
MLDTSVSLLERLRNQPGDADWNRLVALYAPLIAGWLRGQGVQAGDVDDLTQEVLGVVVRELAHFRHSDRRGAFRAWLRTITVHRLRDFWRARQHRPLATGDSDFARNLEQLEDPHSSLARQWDEEHDRHVVRQLLRLIEPLFEPTTLEAFRAIMLDGCRPAEVAARLDISVNAVLLAKSRVLRRLRQEADGLID